MRSLASISSAVNGADTTTATTPEDGGKGRSGGGSSVLSTTTKIYPKQRPGLGMRMGSGLREEVL